MQLMELCEMWPAVREIKCRRQGLDVLEWLCERKLLSALSDKLQNRHGRLSE